MISVPPLQIEGIQFSGQILLIGVAVLVVVSGIEVTVRRILRISPLYAVFLIIFAILTVLVRATQENSRSGREWYHSGPGDELKRMGARAWEEATGRGRGLEVNDVSKRDQNAPSRPVFEPETSTIILGATGTGKSTFVKSRLQQWDFDGALLAHALSEPGNRNEFAEFFDQRGQDVIRLSSRNSDVRWNPFLDFEESMRDMESLATGILEIRSTVDTGWSEPAHSLLTCALAVTSARHRDFAKLPDVLEQGPDFIIEEVEKIPNSGLVVQPLQGLSDNDRSTVYTTLLNEIRPLLQSEIFDESLESISLREYFENPAGRVIVLDNVRTDRYARGFWRFLCQTAIDLSFSTDGKQQFLLDEIDKLPHIDNLPDLASAGRSAGVRGMLVAQDIHQIEDIYGELAYSLWANCPNRVCFRAGDRDTAELALSSIGDFEMPVRDISTDREGNRQASRTIEEQSPLVIGDLTDLEVGEVLIQSPEGWWLCKPANTGEQV